MNKYIYMHSYTNNYSQIYLTIAGSSRTSRGSSTSMLTDKGVAQRQIHFLPK